MPQAGGALAVRLHGGWQDRSLDYDASVQLEGSTLTVDCEQGMPPRISLTADKLMGAELHGDTLTVHRSEGRPVVFSADLHLDGLRNRLEAAVCVFPAQTLSLRGFGSERSAPGSDHDRWFEALLHARRVAEESRTIETQRRAFDAARFTRHALALRESWAAERFAEPADRRAMQAELEELAAPFTQALRQLEHSSLRLRQAPDAHQFDAWRKWTDAVQRTFRGADDVWMAIVPVLVDSRGSKGSFWRRLIRRGGESRR
jgi:hypothetical protein